MQATSFSENAKQIIPYMLRLSVFCTCWPTQNNFHISTDAFGNYDITVRDAIGSLIYKTQQLSTVHETAVITAGWAKGVYFVAISNEKGNVIIQKLIVK
jgi:hypothetical protein